MGAIKSDYVRGVGAIVSGFTRGGEKRPPGRQKDRRKSQRLTERHWEDIVREDEERTNDGRRSMRYLCGWENNKKWSDHGACRSCSRD